MIDKDENGDECKSLQIGDAEDYKEKIKAAYKAWEEDGFSQEWLERFENSWYPETTVWKFIELLKAKKTLREVKYKEKEKETIAAFEKSLIIIEKMRLVMKAEAEAFEKAGIKVGRVEYECPICGGKAIANRYTYNGSYHGLGSGCPTCGTSHT